MNINPKDIASIKTVQTSNLDTLLENPEDFFDNARIDKDEYLFIYQTPQHMLPLIANAMGFAGLRIVAFESKVNQEGYFIDHVKTGILQ